MPVYYKGQRMAWVIPGADPKESVNLDPTTFDPDMLPGNEIHQGNGQMPLVRIPRIPGRITTRKDGYIELITSRHYDREARQSRNKKVIIGSDASFLLPGMMAANDTYYEYFNTYGELFNDPMKEAENRRENEQQTQPTEPEPPTRQQTKPPAEQLPKKQQQAKQPPQQLIRHQAEGKATEPIRDEILQQKAQELSNLEIQIRKREQELRALEEEISAQKEEMVFAAQEAQRDHIRLLSYMLEHFMDTIKLQANRKPNAPMTLRQVRTINEVLKELKEFFTGAESEDYLHLAEEPDPDNDIPGTTTGEMALLLGAYHYTINAFLYNDLRTKQSIKP